MNADHIKTGLDIAASATAFATFVQWLPAVAALLSIIWTAIRIFEWIEHRRAK